MAKNQQQKDGKKTVEDAEKILKGSQGGDESGNNSGEDGNQSGNEQNNSGGENQGENNGSETGGENSGNQAGESGNDGAGENDGNSGENGGAESGNNPGGESKEEEPAMPIPTDEEIEAAAQKIAKNPEALEATRKLYERALNINRELNKPAPASAEEVAAAAHERLVKKYGKDFVTAKRGKEQMIFSRQTWNAMGRNKQGWFEVTKDVPEAQA